MASSAGNSDMQAGTWPAVQRVPLIVGGSLIAAGAVAALAGLAIAGTHLVSATRQWMAELETPPSELAKLKWEQARSAALAGAESWRKHPNSQVRLARRDRAG